MGPPASKYFAQIIFFLSMCPLYALKSWTGKGQVSIVSTDTPMLKV